MKKSEPDGSEKYKEVKNNIKRRMKKAKENWIGKQCSETEETPRKKNNNSNRAHRLVKDLTTVKQGKANTVQDRSGKCLTEEREILNRWIQYCTELYNHKPNRVLSVLNCPQTHTGDDHPHPSHRSGGCSSIIEEREVSWSRQPAELVQAGGEDVITALTKICNKI